MANYLTIAFQFASALGLAGNSLMFIVYTRRDLRKLSVSTYFRSLALANLAVNLISIQSFIEKFLDYNIASQSTLACKLVIYMVYATVAVSAWLEVAASLDRFIVIFYLNRFAFVYKPHFRRTIVILIFLFNSSCYLYLLLDLHIEKFYDGDTQTFRKNCVTRNLKTTEILDVFNSVLVPFVIMLVTSCATLVGLLRARTRVSSNMNARCRSKSIHSSIRHRDIKFCVTLLILNAAFLVLNLPNQFVNLVYFYFNDSIDFDTFENLSAFAHFFNSIGFSATFFIQAGINSLVRKKL